MPAETTMEASSALPPAMDQTIAKGADSELGGAGPASETADGETSAAATQTAKSFIMIKETGAVSRGRTMRLKADDVILAIEGEAFHDDIDTLLDILYECDPEEGVLMTIFRRPTPAEKDGPQQPGQLFNTIAYGPIGSTLEYAKPEIAKEAAETLEKHSFKERHEYKMFEILRDIHRKCDVIDTEPSALAMVFPPAWLLQKRLMEPLLAVVAVYGITLSVHWLLFIIAYGLFGLYFKQAQITLLRSFSIFKERSIWMIVAASSVKEAQETCRLFDPKCTFTHSQVPPPHVDEAPPKRRRRRPQLAAASA